MKKFIVLSLLLLGFFSSNAQYYKYQGYMGKKFLVKYQFGTGFKATILDKVTLGIYHAPEIEYVLSKKYSLITSVEFQRSNVDLQSGDFDLTQYNNYDPNKDYISSLKNTTIILKLRRYLQKRGSFAPYGTYYGLMLGAVLSNTSFFVEDYIYSYNDRSINAHNATTIYPYFGAQFGRQFVFAKRAVIDGGFALSYPLGIILTDRSFDGDAIGNQQESNGFSQIFKVYISVGFLAF